MLRALIGKIASLCLSLLVASLVVFGALNLLPGNVAQVILGNSATPESVLALQDRLGLNDPLWERYLRWLGGLLHGDLGTSVFTGAPIGSLIGDKLSVTLWLVTIGMVLAVLIALPIGMYAAQRRKQFSGQVVSILSQVGMAVPAFLLGIILVLIFSVQLGWLPANGYTPLSVNPLEWARRLVLPATSLAIVQAAVLVRYVRNAFIDVLSEDYLRTARSIGWQRRPALVRHGMRNAALQIVTVLGLQLATLLVGAIIIEKIFVLPGLGSLLLDSVGKRDLPIVQAIMMLLVAFILLINTLVDVAYLFIDPRLRTEAKARQK